MKPAEDIAPGAAPQPEHRRRPRYAGRHPRKFEEKYKEHQPGRYAADIQHILDAGKTPAGMHRPVCVREVTAALAPRPGEVAVDATLGYGGHAVELLKAILPGGRLYALDVDPIELPRTERRLRTPEVPAEALVVRRANFAGLARLLAEEGVAGADMILADLGISSMQLDNPGRGFSFKQDGPLDLRMNPGHGQPASQLLATLDETALAELLAENADEPHAAEIAAGICRARARNPLARTRELARAIRETLAPRRLREAEQESAVRRAFQALRIEVNDEFGALEAFLRYLPDCLKPNGRVAILTFHSGEDRRVKKAFQAGERGGVYSRVAEEVIRPSAEEIRANPRSASAKLRWAVRG